jgi:hypothetical protein
LRTTARRGALILTEPKPPKRSTTMASPVREIPSKIGWWTPYLDLQLDVGLSIGKKKRVPSMEI